MKRAFLVSALLALLLAACGNGSVGIIGGADGPTTVIVSDQDKTGRSADGDEAQPLTDAELAEYTDFLNRIQVNGFLWSQFDTPLEADLMAAFYNGAGVGETPTEEQLAAFLEANGWEEAYTDVTFLPAAAVDWVLESCTGYSLADMEAAGNPFFDYYPAFDGYFQAAGDTNYLRVECTAGVRYPHGRVVLESREAYDQAEYNGQEDNLSTFLTALLEEDGSCRIVSNEITGGWLLDYLNWKYAEPEQVTAEEPPLEYAYFAEPPKHAAIPVTLEKRSEEKNGISPAEEWAEAHREEWARAGWGAYPVSDGVPDPVYYEDEFYSYGIYGEHYLDIYDIQTGNAILRMDFSAWPYPLRWARWVNGVLYVSSFHRGYAASTGGRNAYVTALDPWSGAVIWQSEPLVCNSLNFEILGGNDDGAVTGGVIVCGYGFTNEDDWLCQLSLETGEVLSRAPLATAADYIISAGGVLYVHCYDRDYEFGVSFG